MVAARRAAACVVGGLLAALVVSGAWLWLNYRPTAPAAWNDVLRDVDPAGEPAWRVLHRWAGNALPLAFAALGVLHLADERRRRTALLGLAATGVAALAALTGYFLPWDQLALRSVTVGTGIRGMGILWDADVLFVLMGDAEVATGTVRRWAVLHLVLAAALLLGATAGAVRRRRRPRPGPARGCSTTTSRT